MNVPGSLSSALQTMYFGFGVSLTTNFHFMPGGKSGAAAPFQAGRRDDLDHLLGLHRERLAQPFVALVLQIEIERVGVRLADEFGENRFHVQGSSVPVPVPRSGFPIRSLMMAARQRVFAARAQIVHELLRVFGLQALVPAVVHHHERRAIARAEALDFHQREHARRIGAVRFGADAPPSALRSPVRRRAARTAACGTPARRTCPTGRV